MKERIAIVDDDPSMRRMLVELIRQAGYDAHPCSGGEDLLELLSNIAVDLVVVDLNLDGEDGMEIVKRMAGIQTVPVIIITGGRKDGAAKAVGLELGADDFIEKPFSAREFICRVKICLDQSSVRIGHGPAVTYRFSGWLLNVSRRSLNNPAGEEVPLSASEFTILRHMLEARGAVLSRFQLAGSQDVSRPELGNRHVDVVINRLRKKLGIPGSGSPMIKTVRGLGYALEGPIERLHPA